MVNTQDAVSITLSVRQGKLSREEILMSTKPAVISANRHFGYQLTSCATVDPPDGNDSSLLTSDFAGMLPLRCNTLIPGTCLYSHTHFFIQLLLYATMASWMFILCD